ncbi:hypothetical protein GCM10027452_32060 [Micromonospora halotolerans]
MIKGRKGSRRSQPSRYRTGNTRVARRGGSNLPGGTRRAWEWVGVMRVSKMTVYRLVHSGELTAVRVGRSFRVPEHAVHEYLRGAFQETA